jgi:hypothetical protein
MSWGTGNNLDYATVKYNATTGDTVWTRRYVGSPDGSDIAVGVATDDSGNTYVTGTSESLFVPRLATLKYDASGALEWTRSFEQGYASCIALGRSGRVYVTGYGNSGPRDYFATVVYNAAGDSLWVQRYHGPGSTNLHPHAMSLDSAEAVYITGGDENGGVDCDFETVAYNSDGTYKWGVTYGGPWNSFDCPFDLALDRDGNVVVVGTTLSLYTGRDYTTVKYSPAVGLEGGPSARGLAGHLAAATILRAPLVLSALGGQGILFDVAGRCVAVLDPLRPGHVDIKPGVYFAASSRGTSVSKMVVTR